VVLAAAVLLASAVWWALPLARDERTVAVLDGPSVPAHVRWRASGCVALLRIRLGPAARRRQAAERLRVIHAVAALAAELSAGQPPLAAITRAGGDPPIWPHARGAALGGADVASALDLDAQTQPLLAQVAACWRAGAESGAGLAASVTRIAESARAAEDVRVDLEGQLAGPRATARLLALLPVLGLGFGMMLGGDPLTWLLTSTIGRLCLAGGVLLTVAGTWWTGRIAAAVERLL
jgi:tight adherence protein B